MKKKEEPQHTQTKDKLAFLQQLDMFGIPIKLHVNQKDFYRTPAGGVLNICVVFLTILAGIGIILELLQQNKPTLMYKLGKNLEGTPLFLGVQTEVRTSLGISRSF
jgi:hypothetical protein